MNNFKFFAVVAVLALACYVGLSSYLPAQFESDSRIRMSAIPMTIGPWVAKDVPLSKLDYEILETKNLIMREYTAPGVGTVLLYIIYSEDNRKVSHPPDVCYMGGGSTITDKGLCNVSPGIKANKMVTEQTGREEVAGGRQLVVYWYRAGELSTEKYFEQQLKIVLRRIFGKKTSAAMIRISTDVREGEEAPALSIIQQFASVLVPLIPQYVP